MVSRLIEVRQVGKRVLALVLSEPLEIGRECDGVLISDPKVSRRHALLTPENEGVVVEDLQSSNGTFVNGERIHRPVLATTVDVVLVGDTVVAVVDAEEPSAMPPDLTTGVDPLGSIALVLDALTPADLAPQLTHTSDGTVTILFSDIENSTVLTNRLGDRAWLSLLKDHNEIIRACLAAAGGVEVKTMGDGFMATFGSSLAGLTCAIAIQRAIAHRDRQSSWPIRVRIGLHTGEVLRAGGDVFGSHVNIAARVASHGVGGQILVSGLLHDLVRPVTDVALSPGREIELKGFPGTHRVHAVHWQQDSNGK